MWEKYTVLIAEDEEINFFLLSEYLEPTGIRVLHAKNGIEALEIFALEKSHIILMDIKMPLMNGFEAAMKIREINAQVPILAQTAYTMPDDIVRLKPANFEEILPKPINESTLVLAMKKYIDKLEI